MKLKQWWNSEEFKHLSGQMVYAKSCSVRGNVDRGDFAFTEKESLESCPKFMDHEDQSTKHIACDDLQSNGLPSTSTSTSQTHTIESRFADIECTLKEHTSTMIEQRNMQQEMMHLLQRIDRHFASEGLHSGDEPIYFSNKFYSPLDASKETKVERRSSSSNMVESPLALPKYNINKRNIDATVIAEASIGKLLYSEENQTKSLANRGQEEGRTSAHPTEVIDVSVCDPICNYIVEVVDV